MNPIIDIDEIAAALKWAAEQCKPDARESVLAIMAAEDCRDRILATQKESER